MTKKNTSQKKDTPSAEQKKKKEKTSASSQKKTEELLAEKEEQLLRTMADLQNVRRRADEDRIRLPQIGAEKVLLALLPVLDNLELALKNAPKKEDDWSKGVLSIFQSLESTLRAEGLERIDEEGVDIDANCHEVLMADESAEKGKVSAILQPGYRYKGRVIRAAKVKGGMQ